MRTPPLSWMLALVALTAGGVAVETTARAPKVAETDWPQFRGLRAGVAEDDPALPDTWSATQNVVWRTATEGGGWSSPVARDLIVLTSVVASEPLEAPKPGFHAARPWLSAHDARTGREVYGRQRLAMDAGGFTASPWAYNGKIFAASEDGDTFVVAAGPAYKLVARNSLGETIMASPAIARGSLVMRTASALYRISAAPAP